VRHSPLRISILAGAALAASSGCLAAEWCAHLSITPPAGAAPETVRAWDGQVDALVPPVAAGADAPAVFRAVAPRVLATYPKADKRYLWQRIVWLLCRRLAESGALEPLARSQAVDRLGADFYAPPPGP
jgi:hypothetical protein